MKKSGAAPSPVVPGRYFVFVERLVREQYQTVVVDAPSEDAAGRQALNLFLAGSVAYMSCTQVEPPTARVRPVREKHLRKDGSEAGASPSGFRTSERFLGEDDSEIIHPVGPFPGTHPAPVTRAQARLLCRNFDASGHSNHSGQGATLWVVLEHCAALDIAYNLHALPGLGYYVERSRVAGDGLALHMSVETEYGPPSE